jgi:hypothetical protein
MENAGAIQELSMTQDRDEVRTIRFQIVLAGDPSDDRRDKTALLEFIKFNRVFSKSPSGYEQIQALAMWASLQKNARKT